MRSGLPVLLTLAAVACVQAQPRQVELFVTTGHTSYHKDNGYKGSGVAIGGIATLPFARHFALEADAQTSRAEYNGKYPEWPTYQTRYKTRTSIYAISGTFRFGDDRIYGFGGIGIGALNELERYWSGFLLARGGVVVSPRGRLLIRAEYFQATRDYTPVRGFRVGLGIRL